MEGKRRVLKIWVISLVAVAALAFFFSSVLPKLLEREPVPDENLINTYDYFYDAEWVESVEGREGYDEYSGFDRSIKFRDGNVTRGMTEENESSFRTEERFFKEFFASIVAGDAEKYNSLFTTAYRAARGDKEKFTPQMIYDIEVERIDSTFVGSVSTYDFNVYYKIFRNDGTFRDDVYSDATRGIRLVIDDSEGSFKVSALKYFT